MKKIAIFGAFWCQNLGDELILKNEIKLIKNEEKDVFFHVFSYDLNDIFFKKSYISYSKYFPIWLKNPKNLFQNFVAYFKMIKVFIESDEVIFWGWWIIYDNEVNIGSNPLNIRFFRAKIAKLLWCKLKSYAIWINIKNEKNYSKLKEIFSLFDEITVRDIASQKHLERLWIKSKIIKDPVFSENNWKWKVLQKLESKSFKAKDVEYEKLKDKVVWISVREWFADRVEIEEMIKTLSQNVKKVIIVPFSFHKTSEKENDYLFLKKIAKKYWIEIKKNISESYKVCKDKEIDVMIWMRLHSIILSYIYGIDLITISYSSKTEEIIKTLD